MNAAIGILAAIGRYGRFALILGLAAGILAPQLAIRLKPFLPEFVAGLLFVAALRIGPRQALGAGGDLARTLLTVVLFQVAFPIAVIGATTGFGLHGEIATALVLMACAAPISGSPNLTIMTGNDPAPALRILISGTALLPLTVIPVFYLSPFIGTASQIAAAAARLLLLIGIAATAAFVIRWRMPREPSARAFAAIDGLSAALMSVLVIALMSAIGPALRDDPSSLAINLLAAFAVNFGLQIAVAWFFPAVLGERSRAAFAIAAGNRNIALFIAALPTTVTDPLLLFIGCYQIPMYLTPLVLGRLHRPPAEP